MSRLKRREKKKTKLKPQLLSKINKKLPIRFRKSKQKFFHRRIQFSPLSPKINMKSPIRFVKPKPKVIRKN